jgi:hypothetical protein
MGPGVRRDDGLIRLFILAACPARSFAREPCPQKYRGRREDRVRAAPAVSYAIVATRFAHEHTGLAEASGLPCAMALRLIRDRPGDPAFRDTIALGQRWPPSNLTPASGRRTQTISPYVKTTLVSRDLTSTAPCPSFATTADAPPVGQDGGSRKSDLRDGGSGIFFAEGLDGWNRDEIAEEISLSARVESPPSPGGGGSTSIADARRGGVTVSPREHCPC